MPGGRLGRILAELSAGGQGWSSARLCGVCPGIAGVTGAGVMLMSGEIPRGSLCSSDGVSHLIEELQYTLGEGPCVDAYQQDTAVAEPDLADPVTRRWPVLPGGGAGGRAGGVRVPVAGRHGAAGGAEPVPGLAWSAQRRSACRRAGGGGCGRPLGVEAQAGAPPDTVAEELERGADFHFVVHNSGGHRLGPGADQRDRGAHPSAGVRVQQRSAARRGGRGRRHPPGSGWDDPCWSGPLLTSRSQSTDQALACRGGR